MDYTHHCDTPLGGVTLASDGEALVGLWFDGQKYFGNGLDAVRADAALPVFDEAERWLDAYFCGAEPNSTPKLAPRGTPFRREVWAILRSIPYGEIATYGEIAERLAASRGRGSMSAQAVGGAVGHNPISLIIPCHRVVGRGGSLTGYAGGVDRKLKLLGLEGIDTSRLSIPKGGTAL